MNGFHGLNTLVDEYVNRCNLVRESLEERSNGYLEGIIDSYTTANRIASIIKFMCLRMFDETRERRRIAKNLLGERLNLDYRR